jgi:rhodanese-related sulfurtransferase
MYAARSIRTFAPLIACLLGLQGLAQSELDTAGVKVMTPHELAGLLGQVVVIDVNEADNYAFAHVPGARLLAYDAITLEVLPADRSSKLVFYCWSPECPAAATAARTAVSLGYTDVHCMYAGITGWQDAGLPTEP